METAATLLLPHARKSLQVPFFRAVTVTQRQVVLTQSW